MKNEALLNNAYDMYADFLFRFSLLKTSSRETAEDLVQETFLRMWDYLKKGHPIEYEKAFLFKTMRNLIIDHYRKRKMTSLEEMNDHDGFDPAVRDDLRTVENSEVTLVRGKMELLPTEYRDAVFLRFIEGLPPAEIAAITGEDVNVISVRITRGLQKLRDLLHLS